jgi:hypothetical protein
MLADNPEQMVGSHDDDACLNTGGSDPDPSPGRSIPLQRSASAAAPAAPAPAAGQSTAAPASGDAESEHNHRNHRRAHTTMSSSVASGAKVKINIPGQNEGEAVVRRKGRFTILKDTAVTVVAPGPGDGHANATGAGADAGDGSCAAATPADPAPVGVAASVTDGSAQVGVSAVSSTASGAKLQQSSTRGSPNKPPLPSPHTRSKSDSSAASVSANAQRGVATTATSLASTAAQSAAAAAAASTSVVANPRTRTCSGNGGNERVDMASAMVGATGNSSATTSPINLVETITPATSFSPSILQPHLGASPVMQHASGPVKQKGRFSITPASGGTAGPGGGGAGDQSASSAGGRPPQHLQQPRLPPKHLSSQDSEATPPLAPSVDTRPKDWEEKMQKSPKHGQSAEARSQQQQEKQTKANVKRQFLAQQQQGSENATQNAQDHPSQPGGLFPEKHVRAAATDKALGGITGTTGAGRPGGQVGGMGKLLFFLEQMRAEVNIADKTIKNLQVRHRNR